jgi:hypothetical protein
MTKLRYIATWSTPDGRSEERAIASVDEVLKLVQQLRDQALLPTMLLIWEPERGRELGVGLGRDWTVFTYQSSVDPPYFISAGRPDIAGEVWFRYAGEQTEYLKRNLVDKELIVPTIKRFMTTSGIPDTLRWERL